MNFIFLTTLDLPMGIQKLTIDYIQDMHLIPCKTVVYPPSVVEETILNGKKYPNIENRVEYHDIKNKISVILEDDTVVTVERKSKWKKN